MGYFYKVNSLIVRLPEPQSSEGTSTSSGNNADSLAMVGIKEDKVDGGSYVKRWTIWF